MGRRRDWTPSAAPRNKTLLGSSSSTWGFQRLFPEGSATHLRSLDLGGFVRIRTGWLLGEHVPTGNVTATLGKSRTPGTDATLP